MISTVTYNGDGATRVFPVAFEIRGEDYVVVFIDGVGVSDRSKYDIINNSIVFRAGDEPVTGTNNVEIVVATSPTEIADLNAPPSGIQTVLENLPDIVLVAEQVVPNLPEILLADNNAATATAQAGIATTQAGVATTKASEASTSAGNALTSENNAEAAETNALSYKNSAESARDIAVASKDTAVTKAGEASTSATQALGYRNEAEGFRDEAEGFASSIDPSNIVHKTGDETIAGVKTFSSATVITSISMKSVDETFNNGRIARIIKEEIGSGNGNLIFETYAGGSGGGERLRITANGNVLVTGSGGLGYGTGSGGTVTQLTSKTTPVTINKVCGQITMHNASLVAGASVGFLLNNTIVSSQDTVNINFGSLGSVQANYSIRCQVNNGSIGFTLKNESGSTLAEAVPINFAIIKGAIS